MKKGTYLFLGLAIGLNATPASSFTRHAPPLPAPDLLFSVTTIQGGNAISGRVFGADGHQPVDNVYVELLDEVYSSIGRSKTDSTGFYQFGNLSQGTFKVKVLPYGTDYLEQTQEVAIQNISVLQGRGHDNVHLDFYLKVRANANAGPFYAPGSIFVQEVPEPARKVYEKGVAALREKKEKEGFEFLKNAIELFPSYYVALDRLGTEYVVRGYYDAALALLTKAVEINPRAYSSTFGLGVSQYNLKQNGEALKNLRKATTLYNKSPNAYLWLGMALKRDNKLTDAETAFKRANDLSKGKSAEVHWQMARFFSEQNRYKDAADELELFLKYQTDKQDEEKIKQMIQKLREKAAKQ